MRSLDTLFHDKGKEVSMSWIVTPEEASSLGEFVPTNSNCTVC